VDRIWPKTIKLQPPNLQASPAKARPEWAVRIIRRARWGFSGGHRQGDIIRNILTHCGLWQDPPARGPPPQAAYLDHRAPQLSQPPAGRTCEVDPDFLEHLRLERQEQPELPWDD